MGTDIFEVLIGLRSRNRLVDEGRQEKPASVSSGQSFYGCGDTRDSLFDESQSE